MHWEIGDFKVHCEGDIDAQVAHPVGPRSLAQASLTQGTALSLQPPPATLMGQAWKMDTS